MYMNPRTGRLLGVRKEGYKVSFLYLSSDSREHDLEFAQDVELAWRHGLLALALYIGGFERRQDCLRLPK